jgi:hypothetical protein
MKRHLTLERTVYECEKPSRFSCRRRLSVVLRQEITVAADSIGHAGDGLPLRKETGKTVKVITVRREPFQQIKNGSLSTYTFRESRLPQKVEAAGLTEPGSYYQYAKGKIVICPERVWV